MLTLAEATQIVDAALAHARSQGLAPMTVAVLDARGCVVALKMEDGSSLPVAGGVLVRSAEGTLLGAVGASGDVADNDEACAVAGITAVALTPDAGTA